MIQIDNNAISYSSLFKNNHLITKNEHNEYIKN